MNYWIEVPVSSISIYKGKSILVNLEHATNIYIDENNEICFEFVRNTCTTPYDEKIWQLIVNIVKPSLFPRS
jgi:hypothetical protein